MRSTPSPAITAFCPSLLSSLWARCCTSAFCPKQSTPSSKFDKIFDSHYNIGVYSVQVHLGNIPLFKVYLKTKKMPDISQTQTGCKAKSRRNSLWIPRRFNAKSRCVCRNRLNFRLFRYTLVLSETSKSSSVSVNAAGFCACERSAIFVALRCTSGAGADRNRQGGTGNQGRGRGDKKAKGISAANPHPVVKGERRPVGGRAIHQTHTRRRKHRKPAIPPTRRPPSRQTPPQNRRMRNK